MSTYNLSSWMPVGTVRTINNSLLRFLNELRTNDRFQKLFDSAKEMRAEMSLEMPTLSRRKHAPKKMRDYYGQIGKDHACETAEQFYRTQYFEVIDLMITKINDRFDQETLNYLISIEDVVVKAAKHGNVTIDSNLQKSLEGGMDIKKLESELNLLPSYIAETQPSLKDVTSIATVMDVMEKGKLVKIFSELYILLKLYLTIPLSNATAERSFSALRRVKTYLRNILTQEHLNHYLILHAHKYLTDVIDLENVLKHFVMVNERIMKFFGM